MFPSTIDFNHRPKYLERAIENLPECKGEQRQFSAPDRDLAQKLQDIPIEKLKQWKMKSTMLSRLPYLVMQGRDPKLRAKILAISIHSMSNFTVQSIALMVPYCYSDPDFMYAINARFLKEAPQSTWLKDYYEFFRYPDIAQQIARRLEEEKSSILQIHTRVQCPKDSPLFAAICQAFLENYDLSQLKNLPFSDVIECCQKGYPLFLTQEILYFLLKEYCSVDLSLSVLSKGNPLRMVLELSLRTIGSPRLQRWSGVPYARYLAQILEHYLILERYLSSVDGFRRVNWWKAWIENIEDIVVSPAGYLCIYCADFVCIEYSSMAQYLYMYDRRDFTQEIEAQIWDSSIERIQLKGLTIERERGWQVAMNDWMKRRNCTKSERW